MKPRDREGIQRETELQGGGSGGSNRKDRVRPRTGPEYKVGVNPREWLK